MMLGRKLSYLMRRTLLKQPVFTLETVANTNIKLKINQALINCRPVLVVFMHDLVSEKALRETKSNLPVNKFSLRSHTCGELNTDNVGCIVQLSGWVEYQRMNKFIILRDAYGSTQLTVHDNRKDLMEIIENLTLESVISVTGTVLMRPKGQENKRMKTGHIEVQVDSIEVVNVASNNLPFSIREYNKATELTQMKYRYLSLRYPEMQRNLRLRSRLLTKMREYLINGCDFVEVETPTLFRCTPGGAQEFIVPTRHPGKFYSLVQSPQQFKQLLMVGGIDRYFQIARCYRDESGRYDRQPEFTQLDIEISFADHKGVMDLIEEMLVYSWPENMKPLNLPFKRMKYDDSMEFYGTDKPDLRIPCRLQNITEIVDFAILRNCMEIESMTPEVYALVFPSKHEYFTRNLKEQFNRIKEVYFPTTKLLQFKISDDSSKSKLVKIFSNKVVKNLEQKLHLQNRDVLFLTIGCKINAQTLLGKIRVEFANALEIKNQKVRTDDYEFVWISDFPLFELNKMNELETMHHPFTQPHPEDIEYLTTDLKKVRGLHYDLVLNGSEIGGGSVRIHDTNLQREILKLLKIDETQLTHMLDALSSGAPPHSGIALGIDRLVCLLCNAQSIKSVIAFPKSSEGRDLMSDAPVAISDEIKQLYNIKTVDK